MLGYEHRQVIQHQPPDGIPPPITLAWAANKVMETVEGTKPAKIVAKVTLPVATDVAAVKTRSSRQLSP
jgi:hypothetical protein